MTYAKNTKVPVSRLQKAGASGFGYANGEGRESLYFIIEGRQVRIISDVPEDEREHARRWRCLLLIVKAKLEAVDSGISTIEREFLHDIVMSNGQTVGAWLSPQLKAMYESAKMPPMLPGHEP